MRASSFSILNSNFSSYLPADRWVVNDLDAVAVRILEVAGAGAIAVGARVFHQKFGYGTVKATDNDRLDVAFDKAGEKRVLDRFVEKA